MRACTDEPISDPEARRQPLAADPARRAARRRSARQTALLGSLVGVLLAGPLVAAPPAASRSLAFERDGAVWVASADGSGQARVVDGVDPRIAPNGRAIAYTMDTSPADGVRRHIAVVELATRASRVLTRVPGDNSFGPEWSPDGSALLVYVLTDGQWNLGLVSVDDTAFRYLVRPGPGVPACWSAAWAPDGASIFCQDLENMFRVSLDGRRLWTASLARLFPAGGLNSGARMAPSPDGRSLLVDVDMDEDTAAKDWDGPPPAVFLVDLETETSRRLTAKGLLAWQPAWLDATQFLCTVQRERDRTPVVARLPVAGGPPALLVKNALSPGVSASPAP
jgi:TolB protein